jgi:hypothetical protein
MGVRSCTVEEVVARIATLAHGIVTRRELLDVGVTPKEIELRIKKGALIPEYPGVCNAAGHLLAILNSAFRPRPEVLTPSGRKPKGLRPSGLGRSTGGT